MRVRSCALAGVLAACCAGGWITAASSAEELATQTNAIGRYGGALVVVQRVEPKTWNPVTAADAPSRDVLRRMMADLITINRETQQTEPGLAKSWEVSADGRCYTLHLRRGIRFSDGHPFDADDVIFTFQVYLDEKVHSPQRDLLVVGGRPLAVRKLDAFTVAFELAEPYAAAERLFDSLAMLPRHLLEQSWHAGKLAQAWGVQTPATGIAGLGPFRLREYRPGERVVLERNPYYWKADRQGNRLPYLDALEFRFAGTEDAQVMRFLAGEADVISRVGARNFQVLAEEAKTRHEQLRDLGPGLEYNFLFFNLNALEAGRLPEIARKQAWFRRTAFRQAVSAAIDRDAIVRLAYAGRATAIWGHVTPGNKLWIHTRLPHPPRSLDRARQLLSNSGFRWSAAGTLLDDNGHPVEFSIVTSASNQERIQIATIIQDDLKQLGMRVQVVPLEFRSLLDRVLHTHDYEACVQGLGSGDVDPNPEMNVWLSSGGTHLWNLGEKQPATPWEAEIDRMMRQQLTTLDHARRKILYDRVQELEAEQLPLICLASPNILVAARQSVGNFRPAILDHYTLWNAEELFLRTAGGPPRAGQ